MQKIINGKFYDTETAEKIAEICVSYDYDSYFLWEKVYRKKNGEFFIYREMRGDESGISLYYWVINHQLEPLSNDEAKSWIESNASVETYISLFGKPEE